MYQADRPVELLVLGTIVFERPTVKLYVKEPPASMGHWVAPVTPSMSAVPFW